MLHKSKRLNLRRDFKRVSAGKRVESPNFKLFLKSGLNTTPLVGISLSKKNFKLAADRNKARRMASKAIEEIYESLPKNLNLIIMPKAQILNADINGLVSEIKNVLPDNPTD